MSSWYWFSSSGYAGGPPPQKPLSLGLCVVEQDGRISVCPDDDYYSGKLSAEDSKALALGVLAAQGALPVVPQDERIDGGRRRLSEVLIALGEGRPLRAICRDFGLSPTITKKMLEALAEALRKAGP